MNWPTPASGMPASGTPAGGSGHGPARGSGNGKSRPPFTAGNLAAVRHGARSPRVYGLLAEQLAAGLLDDRPDLAAYPEAVAAWATAEATAALLRRHVEAVGPVDPGDPETGGPKPRTATLDLLARTEKAAAQHRATLGLDPRSEATLTRDRAAAASLAVDLDALAARGRAVIDARAAAELPAVGDPDDLAGRALAAARAEAERSAPSTAASAAPTSTTSTPHDQPERPDTAGESDADNPAPSLAADPADGKTGTTTEGTR